MPVRFFQPGRCGMRSPPPGLRVAYTTSVSPQKRWRYDAPERSAQLRTHTHTPSPLSNLPFWLASSTSHGSSIMP